MDIQEPFWVSLPVEGKPEKKRRIKVFILWAPYFIEPVRQKVFGNYLKAFFHTLADTEIFSGLQEALIETDKIQSGYTFVYCEKKEQHARRIHSEKSQYYRICWYGKGLLNPFSIRFIPKQIHFGESPNGNAPKQYLYPYVYRFQILNFLDRVFCYKS